MSQLCISGGQSIGASASASFLEGAFLCMCVYMLCMCGQEGLLTLRMRNMWSGRFAYPPPFFGLLWCCGWEPACQCRRCERCELDTWVGRSPGGGHGNPLQYSCLENHMDKAWWTTFWSWTVLWRHTRSSKANTDKRYLFHYRGLECKSMKSRNIWGNRQIWPWSTEWNRAKANRVVPRECAGHSKHPLPTTEEKTLHIDIIRWSTPKSDRLYSLQPKMGKLYTVSKNKSGS